MGYKHSPATAKLGSFMNKMDNTSKSPTMQKCFDGTCYSFDDEGGRREKVKKKKQ